MSSDQTKTAILTAAEMLWAERSFGEVTMRDIVAAAGVNLAAVNYHFGSKDELIAELFVTRGLATNRKRLAELKDAETAGNGRADVTVRIKLDDKVVHEREHFHAGELSPPVVVDLNGATSLTLEVDFGKPVTFDRFFKSVERYLRISNQPLMNGLSSSEPQFIYLKSGYKYYKVNLHQVEYVESMKDYIRVVTKEKVIVSKYRLSDLEHELAGKGFVRIHRSYIVGLRHAVAFTASEVEVGGKLLPIGESYRVFVEKAMRQGS